MKILILVMLLFISAYSNSQNKNFIDQPYLETNASVDTLVTPDRIYLNIQITESDTKGKISVEELENSMAEKLKSIGIVLEKQLTLKDLSSNFEKYFLKQKDVLKSKEYTLLVYDAQTAGKVIMVLEEIGVSNVELQKMEYSRMDALELELKSLAIIKAKAQGESMVRPLNQKLGVALYIYDNSIQQITRSNERGAVMQMAYAEKNIDNFEPIEIAFDKIKVESSVYVKFKLE